MKEILYSALDKKNIDDYKRLIKKIRMDMHLKFELSDDTYIIAIDEKTKKIISCIGLNERIDQNLIDVCDQLNLEEYIEEIQLNMIKIALNYVKSKKLDLKFPCAYWNTFNILRKFGFDIADKERYNYSMEDRRWAIDELKKLKEKLYSNDFVLARNVTSDIEYLTRKLNSFNCQLVMKNENNKAPYLVKEYKDYDEIPNEYLDIENVEYHDPHVFMEDDKYMYCELRKTDDIYEDIKTKIAIEITDPNLSVNGGKLNGYLGLEFPELLIYLKDKETKEIIGYIGLTKNYGSGLYISQIAIKSQYKHMGIGSILVKEAIRRAYANGIDIVSCDISNNNELSLALFSKFGFEEDKERKFGEEYKRFFLDVYEYMLKNPGIIKTELGKIEK